MECQELLVEELADQYDVVLETPEEIETELPWDLEDGLYEAWRDRQWEKEQYELEAKAAEG